MGQLWGGCGVLVPSQYGELGAPVLLRYWCGTGTSSGTGPVLVLQKQLRVVATGPVQGAGTGSVLVLPKQLWGASTGLVLVPAGTGPVEAAIGQRWGAGTSPVLVLVGAGPVLVQQKRL